MVKKTELVAYRGPQPSDIPFIFSSWLKGIRFGRPEYKKLPSKAFFAEMHAALNAILQNPNTVVTLACLKEDPETILGYSVATGQSLHWVFVKKRWRGIGIGSDLVPLNVAEVTMLTKAAEKVLADFPLIKVNLLKVPCMEGL